jgi:hypothetical protein
MTEFDGTRSIQRSLSPPPMDYRFTAVAAAPDSTTAGGRNSDPVTALSMTPISNDLNGVPNNDAPPTFGNTGRLFVLQLV